MQTFDLTSKQHTSRVLASWLSEREGGHVRAGLVALGENIATSNLTADQLANMLGAAYTTASGVAVTAETAMRVSTVYACVALVAGAIASLPVAIYDRITGDKADHDYWWLFNEKACDGWTSAAAWEYLISSKLLYGDGFAELLRDNPYSNRITGWRPLHPTRVQPFRDKAGEVYYTITDQAASRQYVRHSADMLQLTSLGYDEVTMRSPSAITYAAREAIGNSMAAERFSGQFFSQGSTHDIALKSKSSLSKEQADGLRASYLARQAGSRGPLVLHGGLEVEKLSITPVDAELLPTRLFGVNEICRAIGVPPHMVAHTDKTTSWGSGIAEQGAGFVRYTLLRHINPLRQELNSKVWPVRQRFYIEHVTEGLERADLAARSNAHRIAIGRAGEPGWMTVNEVRAIENLPRIAGGDTLNSGEGAPPPDTSAADAATQARNEQTLTMVSGMAAAVQASLGKEPQATVVNITQAPVTVTTPEVRVNLPETVVNVEAVMPEQPAVVIPAPVVNVTAEAGPAPVVNITNEITAEAAPAQVKVVVKSPASSVAEHERDAVTGEILRTRTTFKE